MTRQFELVLPLMPLGLRRRADQAFEIRERAFKMLGQAGALTIWLVEGCPGRLPDRDSP